MKIRIVINGAITINTAVVWEEDTMMKVNCDDGNVWSLTHKNYALLISSMDECGIINIDDLKSMAEKQK